MAIIFIGKDKCPVCGKILTEHDEIVSFPPVSDTANPLYQYFDKGFHKSCFEHWDKKEEIQTILENERKEFEKSHYYKEILSKYGKPK
jgi:hypothetical protein